MTHYFIFDPLLVASRFVYTFYINIGYYTRHSHVCTANINVTFLDFGTKFLSYPLWWVEFPNRMKTWTMNHCLQCMASLTWSQRRPLTLHHLSTAVLWRSFDRCCTYLLVIHVSSHPFSFLAFRRVRLLLFPSPCKDSGHYW